MSSVLFSCCITLLLLLFGVFFVDCSVPLGSLQVFKSVGDSCTSVDSPITFVPGACFANPYAAELNLPSNSYTAIYFSNSAPVITLFAYSDPSCTQFVTALQQMIGGACNVTVNFELLTPLQIGPQSPAYPPDDYIAQNSYIFSYTASSNCDPSLFLSSLLLPMSTAGQCTSDGMVLCGSHASAPAITLVQYHQDTTDCPIGQHIGYTTFYNHSGCFNDSSHTYTCPQRYPSQPSIPSIPLPRYNQTIYYGGECTYPIGFASIKLEVCSKFSRASGEVKCNSQDIYYSYFDDPACGGSESTQPLYPLHQCLSDYDGTSSVYACDLVNQPSDNHTEDTLIQWL